MLDVTDILGVYSQHESEPPVLGSLKRLPPGVPLSYAAFIDCGVSVNVSFSNDI